MRWYIDLFLTTGGDLGHAWPPAEGLEPGRTLFGDMHLDADESWIEGKVFLAITHLTSASAHYFTCHPLVLTVLGDPYIHPYLFIPQSVQVMTRN